MSRLPHLLESKDLFRICLLEFLTLRDIWNLFNYLESYGANNLPLYSEFAVSIGGNESYDSFFDFNDFDCVFFLKWCQEHDISMKRLFLRISKNNTKYSKNVLKAVDSYLQKFGSSVLAVSLKFTVNCSSASSVIQTVFHQCRNVIMFSTVAAFLSYAMFANITRGKVLSILA